MKIRTLLICAVLSLSAGAQAAPGFTKIGTASATTFTDSGCQNQTTCYYQVTAVDSQGHESVPAACNTTTLCFAGNQVVAVMPSSGTHTVSLSWGASGTSGATYNIYRAVGPLAPTGLGAIVN